MKKRIHLLAVTALMFTAIPYSYGNGSAVAESATAAGTEIPAGRSSRTEETELKKTKEYETLSCKGDKGYERATCLAEKLDEIKDKADETDDRKHKVIWRRLYDESLRVIKKELAKSYDISDMKEIGEAREKFNDLSEMALDHDNAKFHSEIRNLKNALETETRNRVASDRIADTYENQLAPQISDASYELDMARESGNLQWEFQAKSKYDSLMMQSKVLLRDLQMYNPEKRIERVSRLADISFFDTYYKQNYESVLGSLREMGASISPIGSQKLSFEGPRQSRNPGFAPVTSVPQYGSPYNNVLVQDDPMSSLFDNSASSTFASQYLANNPGAVSGGRGRF